MYVQTIVVPEAKVKRCLQEHEPYAIAGFNLRVLDAVVLMDVVEDGDGVSHVEWNLGLIAIDQPRQPPLYPEQRYMPPKGALAQHFTFVPDEAYTILRADEFAQAFLRTVRLGSLTVHVLRGAVTWGN